MLNYQRLIAYTSKRVVVLEHRWISQNTIACLGGIILCGWFWTVWLTKRFLLQISLLSGYLGFEGSSSVGSCRDTEKRWWHSLWWGHWASYQNRFCFLFFRYLFDETFACRASLACGICWCYFFMEGGGDERGESIRLFGYWCIYYCWSKCQQAVVIV